MKKFWDKIKGFFKKIGAFFARSKPFFQKIGAFFAKLRPFFDKISPFFKKYGPIFLRIVTCVSALFFAVYTVLVVTDSDKYLSSFFEKSAYVAFDEDMDNTEALAQKPYDRLYGIAERLEFAASDEDVRAVLSEEYQNLIYFVKDKAYRASGDEFTDADAGYAEIRAVADGSMQACSKIYFDMGDRLDTVAFYIPVRGSQYIDGLAATYPVVEIVDLDLTRREDTSLLMLIDTRGNIISESTSDSFGYTSGSSLRDLIGTMTPDGEVLEKISTILAGKTRGQCMLEDNKYAYTLAFAPISAYDGNIWLVNISRTDGLLSTELEYVRHIINISAITLAALAVIIVYVVLHYRRKHVEDIHSMNANTPGGCPNGELFRINASKLLQNKERKYALAVIEIRQFRYICENVSESDRDGLLEYVAKVIMALCNVRECYGYLDEGRFALLIHVENDREVKDRIRLIESVAGKNAILGAGKAKRRFNIGISVTQDNSRQSFGELLGYANIACEKAKNNINVPYVVFNEQIKTERTRNEQIEAEMENALANDEFRLFLQPKYNVEADRIDSAEALVRWFDTRTGDYRFPGEFIGLFESNGFITKLDHFMYIEALKYLSSAAERFDKIVPISVNVSMVTVSAPDFLDFYVENKKKYRVGDNFIVIEFTESFAMEDYNKIREIVDTLHNNGIRCSLDDFGSGYSSLGTLKNIPFDEIKFDRLFLSKGYDKKSDDAMLSSMFSLAKTMGIKVVQEGVEDKATFDSIVAKGCDVIQGYYYAKAIPVEEYRLFINSNTSIKYKSRVK